MEDKLDTRKSDVQRKQDPIVTNDRQSHTSGSQLEGQNNMADDKGNLNDKIADVAQNNDLGSKTETYRSEFLYIARQYHFSTIW